MLAFAGIERDRRGLGPFPLIKRYGDSLEFQLCAVKPSAIVYSRRSYRASWVSLQVAARTDLYASLPHPKHAFPLADR